MLFGLALLASGCGALFQGEPRSGAMEALVGGSQMRAGELRVRVRALAAPFSGELELAADEVAALRGTPEAAQALARFKLDAIPAMQAALFQSDPVAALVDAWAFVAQLRQVIARVQSAQPGVDATLGPAEARFESMERQLASLWSALTARRDTAPVYRRIHAWAERNPVENIAVRPSTAPLLADVTGTSGISPMGAAAELVETAQDLSARADLLSAWFPKLARWHVEYFTRQAITDPTLLGDERRAVSSLLAAVEELTDGASDARSAIADERGAIFEQLAAEREALQGFVREERVAVSHDLANERARLVQVLRTERRATLDQLDHIVRGWIHRVFVLTLVLLALGLVGALILVLTLRRRPERRPVERREPADAPA